MGGWSECGTNYVEGGRGYIISFKHYFQYTSCVSHHLNLCVVFSTQPTRATSIQSYSVSEIVGLHHGVAGTWSWYFLNVLRSEQRALKELGLKLVS